MLRKIALYSLLIPLFSLVLMLTSTDGLAWPRGGGFGARPFYQPARISTFQPRSIQAAPVSPRLPSLNYTPSSRIFGIAPKLNFGRRASQPLNMSSFGIRQSSTREKLMASTATSSHSLRVPTQSEIRKGFTGRFTSDGRALVRLRDRIVAVPASQISGAVNKLIFKDQAKTNWTTQQQSAINARVKAIASGNISVPKRADDWPKLSAQLKDAAKGKANFGIGSGTKEQAETMGKAWVGDGHKVASDGKTLISADGLRQYRPPSYKPKLNKTQANFEQRFPGQQSNLWQSNAHLDITD